MPECDYCGESFDDEDALLDHFATTHEDELSAIDRRRVEAHDGDDGGGLSVGPAVLGGLLVVAVALVVWVTFFMGNGGGGGGAPPYGDQVQQPTNIGGVHAHGPMTVVVDGEEVDFSQDRYQLQADAFHFENNDGSEYHLHGQRVTLEFALESLGFGVTENTLVFDGTAYNATSGDTVVYEVNGEPVNPETYTVQGGDSIRVAANSSA